MKNVLAYALIAFVGYAAYNAHAKEETTEAHLVGGKMIDAVCYHDSGYTTFHNASNEVYFDDDESIVDHRWMKPLEQQNAKEWVKMWNKDSGKHCLIAK